MSRPAANRQFDLVNTWIFDLDDTLYPRRLGLAEQMESRIRIFIAKLLSISNDDAVRVHRVLYERYGTSMRGLMLEHGVAPAEFLDFVHRIDHSPLAPNPALGAALERLPGRKLVLTNGPRSHADAVMRKLGVRNHFDDIFDIIDAELEPKPSRPAYERFLKRHAVDPTHAAMFEDIARNLLIPHQLGMTTVLVLGEGAETPSHAAWKLDGCDGTHVHHTTRDLVEFLKLLSFLDAAS